MVSRSPKGDLTLEYIRKFPNTETKQLAKMLVSNYPEAFSSVDNARNMIRYYRGATGKCNRKKAKIEAPMTPPQPALPPSDAPEWLPHTLPNREGRYLIFADTHIPYHNPRAIETMVAFAKELEVTDILILGDFIDCYQLSRFEKSPVLRNFKSEVDTAKQVLDYLSSELDPQTITYKLGNHEERLEHYIYRHAPALFGVEGLTWGALIDAEARNITLIKDKRPVTCGRLFMIHGHEYSKNMLSPVNPARGVFLRLHECAIVAHSHVPSNHAEPTAADRIISCWSIGCTCDLHPLYQPMSRWTLGFGLLDVTKDDSPMWEFSNYKILKGRVVPA